MVIIIMTTVVVTMGGGTDLLGPTLDSPWVGQGGFRTGFHTVDNCRPPSRFMVSSLSLMWMASVVLLCQQPVIPLLSHYPIVTSVRYYYHYSLFSTITTHYLSPVTPSKHSHHYDVTWLLVYIRPNHPSFFSTVFSPKIRHSNFRQGKNICSSVLYL